MPINNPTTSEPEAKELSQYPELDGDIIFPVFSFFKFFKLRQGILVKIRLSWNSDLPDCLLIARIKGVS